MGNALARIQFTLDIPEEKVAEILKARGVGDDDSDYEAACLAVQDWADEEWPHRLDWITSTPDVLVEDIG